MPIIREGMRLIRKVAVSTASFHKNLGTFIVYMRERVPLIYDDSSF
jgi:hypothetical protein